jgi:hypothetical protein
MAFTRFSSDKDVIQKKLCESTFSGIYHLNTPGNGLNVPYIDDTHIRLQKWGANLHERSFNVENELRGATRKLSSDYQVYNKKPIESYKKIYNDKSFQVDESRASCPAWLFRDMTQHRPHILDKNPQYNLFFSFDNNQSTRMLEKDYYTLKQL